MTVGLYLLGGSKGRPTGPPYILSQMHFTNNTIIKTNDWYYKPGDRASWSRRSKACAGGGLGQHAKPAKKIGVQRLG